VGGDLGRESHEWLRLRAGRGPAAEVGRRLGRARLERLANHEAIAAAKAGIVGLMLSAAATYARQRIRFNAVAPGLTKTPLTQGLVASELAEKASIGMHPLGRLGTPDDVARAIAFLLDPAQDWITGQVLGVDGGLASLKTRQG
jgi:3-oxoacyl-[acyl-carrier protein] reductase